MPIVFLENIVDAQITPLKMIFQLLQRKAFLAKLYLGKELHDISRSRWILWFNIHLGQAGSEGKGTLHFIQAFQDIFFIPFLEINW